MENKYIDVQYQQMEEAMGLAIYKLATDIATKEGSKSQSKNDVTKQAVAYIVKELAIKGLLFNVTTLDLVNDSKSCKTYINAAIRALVNKGLIERYKITSKTSTGTTKTRKGKIVYSKTNYTLVIKEELVDLLSQYGFDINFDKALIPQMHIDAAKEVSSTLIVSTTQHSIPVTKEYITSYDGSRTVITNANNLDIENAIEEFKTRINELEELKENNGKEIEISPVKPLVNMEKLEELLSDVESVEYISEPEKTETHEIVEENILEINDTLEDEELSFDMFDDEEDIIDESLNDIPMIKKEVKKIVRERNNNFKSFNTVINEEDKDNTNEFLPEFNLNKKSNKEDMIWVEGRGNVTKFEYRKIMQERQARRIKTF